MTRLTKGPGIGIIRDVGAIVIRRERCNGRILRKRYIKIKNSGPFHRRWITLARYTWEQTHGPVPAGQRVYHRDGNTLNDDPANYVVMGPGEFIRHCHQLDRQMSEENHHGPRRRAAIVEHNQIRGRVTRSVRYLPHYWYAVDAAAKRIVNIPFKSRRLLLAAYGVASPINGRVKQPSFLILRGARLNEPAYLPFTRHGDSPCIKHVRDVEQLVASTTIPWPAAAAATAKQHSAARGGLSL